MRHTNCVLDRKPHLGRRRKRTLVGVQLDQIGDFGLLARHVGGEIADEGIGFLSSGLPDWASARAVLRGESGLTLAPAIRLQLDLQTEHERYLTEANGLDEATVGPDAAMLDALKGRLLMVFRAALGDGGTRFDPKPPLRFIGHYAEPAATPPMPMPAAETAKGVLEGGRGKPSDAAMSGRVAMGVLVFLFVFTALFIWMAK